MFSPTFLHDFRTWIILLHYPIKYFLDSLILLLIAFLILDLDLLFIQFQL